MKERESEMKISDVLSELILLQRKHGDLSVFVTHAWTEGLDKDSIKYFPEYNGELEHFPERIEIA